jgi:hypothetical protein
MAMVMAMVQNMVTAMVMDTDTAMAMVTDIRKRVVDMVSIISVQNGLKNLLIHRTNI